MNYNHVAPRIASEVRAEMARQRFTQARLSKETGISESTLKRRLLGQYPFDLDELSAVAAALHVSPAHFFAPIFTEKKTA